MKRNTLLIATLAFLLTDCSVEETEELPIGDPIEFRANVGAQNVETRGVENKIGDLDHITVTAITSAGQKYFHDVSFIKTSTSTDGSGNAVFTNSNGAPYYWPSAELCFYAWYPDIEKSPVGVSKKDGFILPSMSITKFAPTSEIDNQQDLVIAFAMGSGKTQKDKDVNFIFDHALSQIEIYAQNNSGKTYTISGVRIGRVKESGTLEATSSPVPNERTRYSLNFNWTTAGSQVTSYTKEYTNPENAKLLPPSDSPLSVNPVQVMHSAFLIPQQLTAWNTKLGDDDNLGTYLAVKLQEHQETGVKELGWKALPITTGEWKSGGRYRYTLMLTNGTGFPDPHEQTNSKQRVSQSTRSDGVELEVATLVLDQ